jgi:hypothetical protein
MKLSKFKHHTVFSYTKIPLQTALDWLTARMGPEDIKWQCNRPLGNIATVEFMSDRDKFLFDIRWAEQMRILPTSGAGPAPSFVKLLIELGAQSNKQHTKITTAGL